MCSTFRSLWVRRLIGKLGVPYNRRLGVRKSLHPIDHDAGLSPATAESNTFRHTFRNHPKVKRAYAWSHRAGPNDSDERFVGVLEIAPVTSPETAVKVAVTT
jgi:hypothetical protein